MKRLLMTMTAITALGIVSLSDAATSVVNSNQCQRLAGTTTPFLLVLKKGEDLKKSIERCAINAKLKSASISGLGALQNTTLNYFNHAKKTYQKKRYPQFLELLAINGNLSTLNGKPFTHLHVTLSDANYHTIGGHLDNAQVGATVELTIVPVENALVRKYDEQTGLMLIKSQQ